MFANLFSGWHIVILIALVLLLFGATKLPALAKSLGESVRILRKETRSSGDDAAAEPPAVEKPQPQEPPATEPPQRD